MDYKEAIEILELPMDCSSLEEVEKAFKALAKIHHPDVGGVNEKMTLINEARDTLISYLVECNLPALKTYEIMVTKMSDIVNEKRNIERKVEKIERDIYKTSTNKLKMWKQVSLLLTAIATTAFFLGKEIPKEILNQTQYEIINKPTIVQKPIKSQVYIDGMKVMRLKENNSSATLGFPAQFASAYEKYNTESQAYNSYLLAQEKYDAYIYQNKYYTRTWYMLTFTLSLYFALFAWFYNRKIHFIESELTELNNELNIKSQYVSIIKEVFNSNIPSNWTLKDMESSIKKSHFNNRTFNKMINAIGMKKFTQLLIFKGLEMSFLQLTEGNKDNGYEEIYRIS